MLLHAPYTPNAPSNLYRRRIQASSRRTALVRSANIPPTEFKEIRKEWKARKKEEENQRKAEEERARSAQAQANPGDAQGPPDGAQPPAGYQQAGRPPVQLPPIAYQPGAQVPGQYQGPPGGVQQLQEYGGSHMYSGYPASPYGTSNQMYSQRYYAPS